MRVPALPSRRYPSLTLSMKEPSMRPLWTIAAVILSVLALGAFIAGAKVDAIANVAIGFVLAVAAGRCWRAARRRPAVADEGEGREIGRRR
jgi:hypothetical protein